MELGRRYTLVSPQGTISNEGITIIQGFIARTDIKSDIWTAINPEMTRSFLPILPIDWEWSWVVTKGPLAGTFPKRVARYYSNSFQIKVPNVFTQELGNLARTHSEQETTYRFDFDDELEWDGYDVSFGDKGACWLGNTPQAEMLRDNAAWAIRFYDENDKGIARAWIARYDEFNIVFNGYGFSGSPTLTCARVLAMHLGVSYHKIANLRNSDGDTIYPNGGYGYAVGPADVVQEMNNFDLGWDDPHHSSCYNCGDFVSEDYVCYGPDDNDYCERCYSRLFDHCDVCDQDYDHESVSYIEADDRHVCEWCMDRHYFICDGCAETFHNRNGKHRGEMTYCPKCYAEKAPSASPTK